MRTLLPILLFLAYTPFLTAESATPTPLTESERVQILTLMRSAERTATLQVRAEKVALESKLQLAEMNAQIQQLGAKLQQTHNAVGYNLDDDLNWVAAQAPVKQEKPDAATKPESVPDR